MRVITRVRFPWLWLPAAVAGVALQAGLWRVLAPAAKCYVWEGACVFQASGASSPYFVRDLTFGAVGLALGLLLGLLFRRRGAEGGPVLQLLLALLGAGASFAAAQLGALGSEVAAIDDTFAYDRLSLGAWGLILAWPFGTQLAVWFLGTRSRG